VIARAANIVAFPPPSSEAACAAAAPVRRGQIELAVRFSRRRASPLSRAERASRQV